LHTKVHNRLFYRQAKNTALVALLLVLTLSIFQIFLDLRKEKDFIDTTISQVLATVKESAAQAAYALNDTLAAKVVEGLFKYQPIYKAEVIDDFGSVLANQERPLTTGRLKWIAVYLFGSDLRYSLPLLSSKDRKPLGRIDVFVDSYLIALNFINRARVTIISSSVLIVILSAVLTMMFYFSITHPLLKIAGSLSSPQSVKHPFQDLRTPRGHEQNEIGMLVEAINSTGKALVESEEKYRLLVENSNDAIFVVQDRVLKFHNSTTLNLLGYPEEELIQTPFIQFVAPEHRKLVLDRHQRRLKGEKVTSPYSFKILNRYGEMLWVLLSSVRIIWEGQPATLNFIKDISEQKDMENRLKQAYKMEAIGTLAGGIAHDLNNILLPIMVHSEMVMMDLSPDSPIQHNLKEIFKAGERAKDMVKQILAFSRKEEGKRVEIKITPILEEVLKLLRSSIPTTIDIHQKLEAESDTVFADPTQIHQILMNLCTNASHAMRERGGELTINLTEEHLDSEAAGKFFDLEPGPYLKLTVSDTGHGIDAEAMNRIFEPYFTTKETGEGTGMGLAMVHGIVKSYGGDITAESEPGKGTTFNIYLPRIEADVSPVAEVSDVLPMGTERILFVDDEKGAVDAIKPMLKNLGYKVTARTSSIEALEAFRNKSDAFDLVITDQTMPNMTGKDLAKEIMKMRPDIPIILCTGFSEQIDEKKAMLQGIRSFVMKPIVMREMADRIREVLDKR